MPPPLDPKETTPVEVPLSAAKTTVASGSVPPVINDRYAIERKLAHGGMGVVYLARDKKLHDRPVAVKVLLENALRDKWVVRKFLQEKEALVRVDHPGVVGILDTGELPDGAPFIVMQYIEGESLRDAIRLKPTGMELARVALILKQVSDALRVVHEKKIYHRDLKPENILLQALGDGEELVKIVDFGVAKIKESLIAPSTATGNTAGTLLYMSPEQLRGEKVGPASDIYSVALIVYEMVTGRHPFNPETVAQLIEMQHEGVRVKPRDLRPGISLEAEKLILQSLAFDPDERPQLVSEFGRRLSVALLNEDETEKRSTPHTKRATTETTKPVLETAHVLFMDIVGYSSLLIDEQTERLQELQGIVRNTEEFQRAQLAGQLLRLPTGDGMALSFFGDPEAPVRCAVEISRALSLHPDLKLRMGIHSGLVYRIADINENLNISGGGINIAQRVMDCGDAGHIILSKRVAEDIGQLTRWAKDLHDLGEAVVKHGVRVHIYSLHNDEIGNAAVPAKLRAPEKNHRPNRAFLIAASLVVLAVGVFFALKFLMAPTRTLTYSLTVQKMSGDQALGGEIQSTGDELYGNGWKFRVNVTPAEAGSLYMLNEGKEYNVLFPTPANNNSVAQLAAHATIRTGWYFFDDRPLPEKVWIIWSAQPVAELDTMFRDAAQQKLVISDPAKINVVRKLIARSGTAEVSVDKINKLTTIKGRGDVVVALLTLNHNAY